MPVKSAAAFAEAFSVWEAVAVVVSTVWVLSAVVTTVVEVSYAAEVSEVSEEAVASVEAEVPVAPALLLSSVSCPQPVIIKADERTIAVMIVFFISNHSR